MRKSFLIGVVATVLLVAGVTVAWVSVPEGQIAVSTPAAIAQTAEGIQATNQAIADSGQSAVKQAIAAAGPAVVRVDVTSTISLSDRYSEFLDDPFFRRFFNFDEEDSEREAESVGSGVIFERNGQKLVLTNAHVVDGADSIRLTDAAGNEREGVIIGSDQFLDIAVVRIEGDTTELFAAALGDSDSLEIGDWAIAIGNPLGLSYTVTMGIISALDREIAKPNGVGVYSDLIQTDAAINPGNSGGPLVNAHGEIIGINTLIARNSSSGVTVEGINFAIAINGILDVLSELIEEGTIARGWLGVRNTDVTPQSAAAFDVDPSLVGALIVEVFTGDPADLGGIQVGDVVVRIGDAPITSSEDLGREVASYAEGTEVEIEVIRADESTVLMVALGIRPPEDTLATYGEDEPSEDAGTVAAIGITAGPITPAIADHPGLNSSDGVVIMGVTAGSRAEFAGLSEGDIILEVDHRPIDSVEGWDQEISSLEDGDHLTLTILRDGLLSFVTL